MRDESSSGWWGGGLMCGIKIPQQDFALKMQGGGLMHEGGRICGDTTVLVSVSKSRVQVHVTQYYRQPCMYLHSLVFMA